MLMERFSLWIPLGILMLVAACTTPEILLPRSALPPEGADFSGTWVVRDAESADQHRINQAAQLTDSSRRRNAGYRSSSGKSRIGLVDVFLRIARTMTISQTAYGFFISMDRSVVQELRFGEQREISVGEIVAQRVSGWDGRAYVVETLDKKGMKLTERYFLNEDRDQLHREITFRSRNNMTETMLQVFDRAGS